MQVDSSSTFLSLLTVGTTTITGWLFYDRQRKDLTIDEIKKDIDKLQERQAVNEATFVDDKETRSIVRDEMASLKESHAELKTMVTGLSSQVNLIVTSQEVQTQILKTLSGQFTEIKDRRKGD